MVNRAWGQRVHGLAAALEANKGVLLLQMEIGDPATDDEIARVRQRLGYDLDERFLDYFRQCNGVRMRWVEDYEPLGNRDPVQFFSRRTSNT